MYGKLANFLLLDHGNEPLELTNHKHFLKSEVVVDVCISKKYLILNITPLFNLLKLHAVIHYYCCYKVMAQ